jgi:hypothetical protein
MSSSQQCRGYALVCVQLARKSEEEGERAACFEMARAWLRAASMIDDTLPRYGGSLARLEPKAPVNRASDNGIVPLTKARRLEMSPSDPAQARGSFQL